MNPPRCTDTAYIDFLIATPRTVSCVEAARVQPRRADAPAHDAFTRLLHHLEPDLAALMRSSMASISRLALAAWDAWLTTVPANPLTLDETQVLIGPRWQIEVVFKQWKSGGQVDASRNTQPSRVLTAVYAKLLAMLVQQWCILLRGGGDSRRSLVKAAAMVQQHAFALLLACRWWERLVDALHTLETCLASAEQVGKRRKRLSTADLLLAFPFLPCPNRRLWGTGSRSLHVAEGASGGQSRTYGDDSSLHYHLSIVYNEAYLRSRHVLCNSEC